MPNGGNPEERTKATLFYEEIKGELTAFAAERGFEYIPWYHEAPIFLMEWCDKQDGLTRRIQVCLGSDKRSAISSEEEIVMSVFAHCYSDTADRKTRSFYIIKGMLPRDAARVVPALRAAITLLTATRKGDLLSDEEWQKKQAVLTPIVCYL